LFATKKKKNIYIPKRSNEEKREEYFWRKPSWKDKYEWSNKLEIFIID